MDAKLIKAMPPKVEWIDTFSGQEPHDGVYLVFGLINQSTPHECFRAYYAKYSVGLGKWLDLYGDALSEKVTHYLQIKM